MPTPAAEILSKSLLPTWMDSEEIRSFVATEIRQRSLFSAKMTSLTYLKSMQRVCAAYADGQINAADARLRLLQTLDGLGFDTSGQGGLSDPSSPRRLNLILETQRKMASSVARLQAQTPDEREAYPAWRLERYGTRREPREDWPVRWLRAGQAVGWVGACRDQMVALKNSPIWKALGLGAGGFRDTLGNPYPPFAYGSGLEWTDVSAEESERLGLGRYQLTEAERVSLAPSDAELRDAMAKTGLTPEDFLMANSAGATAAPAPRASSGCWTPGVLSNEKGADAIANSEDAAHPKCPKCKAYISKEGAPCKKCAKRKQEAKVPTPTQTSGTTTAGEAATKAKKTPLGKIRPDRPVKKMKRSDAEALIQAGEAISTPIGNVRVDKDTLRHLSLEKRSEHEITIRIRHYPQVKEALTNPQEVWEDPRNGRRKYIKVVQMKWLTVAFFVVTERNGKVLSWHCNRKRYDYYRRGNLLYER